MSSIPKYALQDGLLSIRNTGLQKEIEADLKTLDELNFDSFLEEGEDLDSKELNDEDTSMLENEEYLNEEGDSVDDDNFFLENEEDQKKPRSLPIPSGLLLQECFKKVLGMDVERTIPPPSHVVVSPPSSSSENDEISDIDDNVSSVDDIFEGFSSGESDTEPGSAKSSYTYKDSSVSNQFPILSCPFVTVGCIFQSIRHKDISIHIKNNHKRFKVGKKCCTIEFRAQRDYDNHLKKEHIYKCSRRGCSTNALKSISEYDNHMQTMHATKHKCGSCSYSGSTPAELRHHIKQKHQNGELEATLVNSVKCKVCSKSFLHSSEFEYHCVSVHWSSNLDEFRDKRGADDSPYVKNNTLGL